MVTVPIRPQIIRFPADRPIGDAGVAATAIGRVSCFGFRHSCFREAAVASFSIFEVRRMTYRDVLGHFGTRPMTAAVRRSREFGLVLASKVFVSLLKRGNSHLASALRASRGASVPRVSIDAFSKIELSKSPAAR